MTADLLWFAVFATPLAVATLLWGRPALARMFAT